MARYEVSRGHLARSQTLRKLIKPLRPALLGKRDRDVMHGRRETHRCFVPTAN